MTEDEIRKIEIVAVEMARERPSFAKDAGVLLIAAALHRYVNYTTKPIPDGMVQP